VQRISGIVPGGFSGHTLDLQSFALDGAGQLVATQSEALAIH